MKATAVQSGRRHEQESELLAAVDLGSESFHMVVSREEHGQLVIIDRLKETVRLASGLDEDRMLDEASQQRALQCLARFGQRLRGFSERRVRVVGTSALRRARNSRVFRNRAESTLGHRIQIINGREEARLVYLGVARSMALDDSYRLVMDIGGGSTELIIGSGSKSIKRESLELGCVVMAQEFFGDGRISSKRLRRARVAARLAVEPIEKTYRDTGWDAVIGCSGTIRAVAAVAQMSGFCDDNLDAKTIERLINAVVKAGHVDHLDDELKFGSLGERRKTIFPGGLACLAGLFDELAISELTVSDKALREGLLFDLQGRLRHQDIRDSTVAAICSRYGLDGIHSGRIRKTALTFFDQIADAWGLDEELYRDLLGWAAQLHELGLTVSHSKYHKHGEYLILHTDMAGFSDDEQRALAALIRNHRRKFYQPAYDQLGSEFGVACLRLTCLLRLAVLIHRNRIYGPTNGIRLAVKKRKLIMDFPSEWLKSHPLTAADLENEQQRLKNSGVELRVESRLK